jgi:hypothetical protein
VSWVRKDDQMPIHRKVAPLSDAAYRLYDEALHWSARNLTDGVIGETELKEASKRGQPRYAAELVARRLWHPAGEECASPKCPPSGPDGWVIHDYWDYQPSREKALREKAAKAERQRRWVETRSGKKGGQKDASAGASQGASQDAPEDAPPSPPRPEGRRGGSPAVTAARRTAASAGDGGRKDQPPGARSSPNGRLSGSPNFDAIARSAVRGERRESLAAKAKAAIRRPTLPPGRDGRAFDELRALTTPPADPPEGATA